MLVACILSTPQLYSFSHFYTCYTHFGDTGTTCSIQMSVIYILSNSKEDQMEEGQNLQQHNSVLNPSSKATLRICRVINLPTSLHPLNLHIVVIYIVQTAAIVKKDIKRRINIVVLQTVAPGYTGTKMIVERYRWWIFTKELINV